MRAVLVTAFPEKFVRNSVLPHLRRRVEILGVVHPTKAASIDFASLKPDDVILHMVEFGGHSDSETMSRLCRMHGITIRPLSRKKASWNFLPPPSDEIEAANDDEEIPLPEEEDGSMADVGSLELAAIGRDLKAAREHAGLKQRELAEAVGVTQTTISSHESGKTRASEEHVAKILAACGLSRGWRGLAKEEVVNTAISQLSPVTKSPIESLYEEEIETLKSRIRDVEQACRALENSEAEARSALGLALEKAASLEAELRDHRKREAVQAALRTVYEAGLLTADEVVAKLCPGD